MTDSRQTPRKDLPFVLVSEMNEEYARDGGNSGRELRVGDLCPACQTGYIDYNGMLNLECKHCKFTLAGCAT